jgi:hypothetical protein
MKIIIWILSLFSFLLLVSCNNDIEINESDLLIGNWINPVTNDTIYTFERSLKLQEDAYGLTFDASGKFTERTISGWCATPPVSYIDNEGEWSRNDSIISVSTIYWGGLVDYKWKVISVDKSILKIYKISQTYRTE